MNHLYKKGNDAYHYLTNPDDKKRFELALKLIPKPFKYDSILDVGCGEGWFTNLVSQKYQDSPIAGIDASTEAIIRALSWQSTRIKFSIEDFLKEKYAKHDLILALGFFGGFKCSEYATVINAIINQSSSDADLVIGHRFQDSAQVEILFGMLKGAGWIPLQGFTFDYRGMKSFVSAYTKKPLVSIITTTYNRKDLVKRAIASTRNSRMQSFEHLIVDDGSDKETEAILKELEKEDSRIHIIRRDENSVAESKRSGKPIAPANDALRIAKGKYIVHLGDDDKFRKGRLDEPIRILEQNDDISAVYNDSIIHAETVYRDRSTEFDYSKLLKGNFMGSCEVTYRLSEALKVGGWKCPKIRNENAKYDSELVDICNKNGVEPSSDDWDFWKRLFKDKHVIHYPVILSEIFSRKSPYYRNESKFETDLDSISEANLYKFQDDPLKRIYLLYHRVEEEASSYTVSIPNFRKQMELASKNPNMYITFDGGYSNFLETILPILREFNLTSRTILFVCTDHVGKDNSFDKGQPLRTFATWEDLREISKEIEIGSHSVTHTKLTELSYDDVLAEVSLSKSKIETKLDMKIRDFAYPNGAFNTTTIKLLEDNGYTRGFTTLRNLKSDSLHTLCRWSIGDDDFNVLEKLVKESECRNV